MFFFQAKIFKKKRSILLRVRKKSERAILRKKAQQKEEPARTERKLDTKEIEKRVMKWMKKAGSQMRVLLSRGQAYYRLTLRACASSQVTQSDCAGKVKK